MKRLWKKKKRGYDRGDRYFSVGEWASLLVPQREGQDSIIDIKTWTNNQAAVQGWPCRQSYWVLSSSTRNRFIGLSIDFVEKVDNFVNRMDAYAIRLPGSQAGRDSGRAKQNKSQGQAGTVLWWYVRDILWCFVPELYLWVIASGQLQFMEFFPNLSLNNHTEIIKNKNFNRKTIGSHKGS